MCLTEGTFIDKIEDEYDLESELEVYLQFFTDWCYEKKKKTYCVKFRENWIFRLKKFLKPKIVD